MNKSILKTIFLSMVLLNAGITSRLFSIAQVDSGSQQLDAAFIDFNEELEKIKIMIAKIDAKSEAVAQKLIGFINTNNEQEALLLFECREDMHYLFYMGSVETFHYAMNSLAFKLSDYGVQVMRLSDSVFALTEKLCQLRYERILRYAHLKGMNSVVKKFMHERILINPSFIKQLVKSGDAGLLECLLQNELEDEMVNRPSARYDWLTLSELQLLAEQHSQKDVVVVLQPYIDAQDERNQKVDLYVGGACALAFATYGFAMYLGY